MPSRPPFVSEEPFAPRGALGSVLIDANADAVGDEDLSSLDAHAGEIALAVNMAPARRAAFLAGRQALRAALRQLAPHSDAHPLLQTGRGAPHLPDGWTGSISHKRSRAIALVAPSTDGLLGVDLEERPTERDADRPSIATRILTNAERDVLANMDPHQHREATLVRFALKEAVYKAIDPYVSRYVRFTEVELELTDDGKASVRLMLPEAAMRLVHVEAQWRFESRWIIAMARSVRR